MGPFGFFADHAFSMVYMGIILVTLIISGLVGPNWDLWYRTICNPVARAAIASCKDLGAYEIGCKRTAMASVRGNSNRQEVTSANATSGQLRVSV
jgi:hypothetical protein